MINSKPADIFLDHDHVEDIENCIYVVIGNMHPPGAIFAYKKYIPTSRKTLWRRRDMYFERVIKRYGVRNVMNSIRNIQEYSYDPVLDAKVPKLLLRNIKKHYKPRDRLTEIMRHCEDELEYLVLEVIDRLRLCTNLSYESIGVTGSILVKIHNPNISDIDLIIYGHRETLEVVSSCHNCFEKMPKELLLRRLEGQAKIYGIDIKYLRKIEPPYKNLWFKGKNVNIMFCSGYCERYGEHVFRQLGIVDVKLNVSPGMCEALFYPSRACVDKVEEIYVRSREVKFEDLRRDIKYIISYESIFSYVLFRGGKLRVKGILEKVYPENYYVIIVGAIEEPGYVLPVT